MLLKLIPDITKVPFVRFHLLAAVLSAALVVGSIVALATLGLNFGVDFRGGVTIEVADAEPIDQDAVMSAVSALGLGEVRVQEIRDFSGSDEAVVVFVEQQAAAAGASEAGDGAEGVGGVDGDAQQTAARRVQEALTALLGEDIEFRRIDVVGPAVSGELIRRGASAVGVSIGLMLLYIWFRFEWQFSVGAVLALIHDVLITLGLFAVTRLEFGLAIIAALLTIVGYSMNDTVVVYDRVRENLRKFKKKPLQELLDLSINDTLSRTVMTSLTTLIALVALYLIGGDVLRGFTLAMIWGIVIGTYSSIFVAAPILLTTGVKRDWSGQEAVAIPPAR